MMSRSNPGHFCLEKDTDGAVHLRWSSPTGNNSPSPNWLDRKSLSELEDCLDRLLEGPRPPLVIWSSGNSRGFGTGFSTKYLASRESDELLMAAERLQRCCQMLLNIPCPIIATISGPCLDEALELALCCDYRIVFDSPKTRIGFRSPERQWYPTFATIPRACNLLGLERGFKLIASGTLLQAKTALRWGLADSAPSNEQELRKEIGLYKGKALSQGKNPNPKPRNWVRHFLHANSMGRKWVAKGLKRWMERTHPKSSPWTRYLVTALGDCAEGAPAPLSNAQKAWKLAATDPLTTKSLHFCNAFARWTESQNQNVKKNIQAACCDFHETPIHPILGVLHGKGVRLQSMAQDLQPTDLGIQGLAQWESVGSHPAQGLEEKSKPGKIQLLWNKSSSCSEEAFLWGPFKRGPQLFAVLESPLNQCPHLKEVLAGLDIQATISYEPKDSWISLLFTMIESTLMALAQSLDAGLFDQEARRKGWLAGPCGWMQASDILFLSKMIMVWDVSNSGINSAAPDLIFSRRFAGWIATLGMGRGSNARNFPKEFWGRYDKSGMLQACSTGRKWPAIAKAEAEPAFNALPQKQRHVEAVNRVERALVTQWQKLTPKNQEQAAFVFFHGLLGFPAWKVVSLLPEMGEFWGKASMPDQQ